MLRKLSFFGVAVGLLGAALMPTSASGCDRHWALSWWGPRDRRPVYYGHRAYHYGYGVYPYGGCYVRALVSTPSGLRVRLVNASY
ncbi:hypothetical protein [Bradyrhizobium sp. Tv2a-2]|uniref:hypothetical protein n=1 Tax=Bradyrhizobium sp. Tv2a-2 TaxID=113395 RepID=UPI0009FCF27D|nr:hypothetical protein [Bradyrhizobium sp. Tv2a-2]